MKLIVTEQDHMSWPYVKPGATRNITHPLTPGALIVPSDGSFITSIYVADDEETAPPHPEDMEAGPVPQPAW